MSPHPFHTLSAREQERIRERFLQDQGLPALDIEILKSWQRCARLGRTPSERIELQRLDRQTFVDRQTRERPLLAAAQPVLAALFEAVEALACGVLLTDREGLVLASRIPAPARARLADVMQPGALLDEASVGTNAMVAAMAAARPVHVFGAEHYFESTRGLFCCAAPVFDATARLVGALNVTATTSAGMQGVFALVVQAAAAIEKQLVEHSAVAGGLQLQLGFDHGALRAPSGALLSVSEAGDIVGSNQAARALLSDGGSGLHGPSPRFDALFATPLSHVRGAAQSEALTLTLASGLRVQARILPRPRATTVHRTAPPAPSGTPCPWPDFGDSQWLPRLQQAARAFDRGLPVLLRGETGTGKEVTAHALHQRSARAKGPFVAINCAAIPETLIESELFGHAEGAFTGARRGGMPGKLAQAHGGTLFLDEIGDMPLPLQTRLLRVLERREFVPLGSTQVHPLDVCVISATHCDLEAAMQQRQFRADLYYRLNGVQLHLPPLRARDDYPRWLRALFEKEVAPWERLSEAARRVLLAQRWPGNVRELLNVLRYVAATGPEEGQFLVMHLPGWLTEPAPGTSDMPRHDTGVQGVRAPVQSLPAQQQADALDALRACDGDVKAAAQRLGISRATLYRRMKAQRMLADVEDER